MRNISSQIVQYKDKYVFHMTTYRVTLWYPVAIHDLKCNIYRKCAVHLLYAIHLKNIHVKIIRYIVYIYTVYRFNYQRSVYG